MNLQKSKAVMQIQLDQTDNENIVQDLKEYAATLSVALGYNSSKVLEEMTRDNNEHLIETFKKYFSDYVELLNSDNVIISRNK